MPGFFTKEALSKQEARHLSGELLPSADTHTYHPNPPCWTTHAHARCKLTQIPLRPIATHPPYPLLQLGLTFSFAARSTLADDEHEEDELELHLHVASRKSET